MSAAPREQIARLAKLPGGFASTDLVSMPRQSRYGAIDRALAQGLIFRAKWGHKSVRFFGDKALAEAYQIKMGSPVPGTKVAPKAMTVIVSARTRAPWSTDAAAHYPTDASGRPLYRVTVAPPPPVPTRTNTYSQL